MARAKRTGRAEARRRYRNDQALAGLEDEDQLSEVSEPPSARPRPDSAAPARIGIANAFRQAFRPLDVRADLRALPQLVRTRALWIPVLLTLATTVVFIAVRPEGRTDVLGVLAVFMYQYFVVTPAIGGVFIAGFMAPRASWLLGVLVGLVAAACYSFLVVSGSVGIAPSADTQALARDVVLASFVLSPVVGAFFASTAAWYRRFLYLSNPNRGRKSGAPPRPDGRSRARTTSEKASARR